jgi:hypothetical protein
MGKHVIQIPSEDGCVYVYDTDKKTLQRISDIKKTQAIPRDVRETLDRAGLCADTGED